MKSIKLQHLFLAIIGINFFLIIGFLQHPIGEPVKKSDDAQVQQIETAPETKQEIKPEVFLQKDDDSSDDDSSVAKKSTKKKKSTDYKVDKKSSKDWNAARKKKNSLQARWKKMTAHFVENNPFKLLGAYPTITNKYFNSYPDGKPFYNVMQYGLKNDPGYCAMADMELLAHPEIAFEQMNFLTDYAKNGLVRIDVIRELGNDTMTGVSKYMDKEKSKSRKWDFERNINMIFTKRVDIHIYHEIGNHFLCAGQNYNHIPGHGVLKRKDLIVDSVDEYAKKFDDRPQCFNKKMFFPYSYRLYLKDECEEFFDEINSEEYKDRQKENPIQYLIKVGFGAHRALGVFLLDDNETAIIKDEYDNGDLCGKLDKSLIAQTYITDPLLLDKNNKFDFRVYMLVASTNPTIAFYHDGFLRVSLKSYNKTSNDRSTHLTNTHLSKEIFAQAQNGTYDGMTEKELRDYQMWTLERLEGFLVESGKVEEGWLNEYLRPQFQKAFIHTIRMSEYAFWKGSNVFEMFGLDFMLDDNMNLWFIECNSSPQLIGTSELKTKFLVKMLNDLFEIQYSYYRSRMKRVFNVIKRMYNEVGTAKSIDYGKWKKEYAAAAKNRLEAEYPISKDNGFVKIMDKNLKGKEAYMGFLDEECARD